MKKALDNLKGSSLSALKQAGFFTVQNMYLKLLFSPSFYASARAVSSLHSVTACPCSAQFPSFYTVTKNPG